MKFIRQLFNQFNKSFLRISCSIFFITVSMFQFAYVPTIEAQTEEEGTARLQAVHAHLRLIHGSFTEEYPEQLMTAMYLSPDAKVLELGANVGRNSCVIGALLNDSRNLVAVESSVGNAKLLEENRNVNGLQFYIEAGAVSKVPLIQDGWWTTMPSDVDVPGWTRVNTITFNELQSKYNIMFDTLVADCEGALYYILLHDPDILRNMKMIIIENDFTNIEHMNYVHTLFTVYGLSPAYTRAGGWGPCTDRFYQVWKR